MQKLKEIKINRKKWASGQKGKELHSKQLTDENTMCCLGFLTNQCGVKKDNLLEKTEPNDIPDLLPKKLEWLIKKGHAWETRNSKDAAQLIKVNDNSLTTDAHKEKIITKYFAKHGLKAVFIN